MLLVKSTEMRRSCININFTMQRRLPTSRHEKKAHGRPSTQLNLMYKPQGLSQLPRLLNFRTQAGFESYCSNQGSGQYWWLWLQPYVWGAWVNWKRLVWLDAGQLDASWWIFGRALMSSLLSDKSTSYSVLHPLLAPYRYVPYLLLIGLKDCYSDIIPFALR